jgi:hypothetical protein
MNNQRKLSNHVGDTKRLYSLDKEQLIEAIEKCVEFNLIDSIPVLTELLYHRDSEVVQSSIGALAFLSLQADRKSAILIEDKLNHIKESSNIEIRRSTYVALSSILVFSPFSNILEIFHDGLVKEIDPICTAYILHGIKEIVDREDIFNTQLLGKIVKEINNKLKGLKDTHTVDEEIFFYSVLNISAHILVAIGVEENSLKTSVIRILDRFNKDYVPFPIRIRIGIGLYELTEDISYLDEVCLSLVWELKDIDAYTYQIILLALVLLDELPHLPLESELISTLFKIKENIGRLTKPVDILINKIMSINFKLEENLKL